MAFTISTPAFKNGELIPAKYTCDGKNISPPLEWSAPPQGTVSFSLVVDDPDAPSGDWVHWVLFNIPAGVHGLKEGYSSKEDPAGKSAEGLNDFRRNNYGGPCPPSGTHRYYFRLFSLDQSLDLKESTTKKQLLEAMKGHILAEATLIGRYKRTR